MSRVHGSRTLGLRAAVWFLAACAAWAIVSCDDSTQDGKGPGELKDVWKYDDASLRRVDPELITYVESGAVDPGFREVRAVAVDDADRICVGGLPEDGGGAVRVFDPAGTEVAEIALEDEPRSLAVAPNGTLYVALRRVDEQGRTRDRVAVFGPDGRRLADWPDLGPKGHITSIAATDADIFVADAGNRVVVHYDASGDVVNEIHGTAPGGEKQGFLIPSPTFDVVLDGGERLWVVDPGRRTLATYSYDGCRGPGWGAASPRIEDFWGCCNPAHVAMTPDGRFITSEKGMVRVKVYGRRGDFEGVVAPPATFLEGTGPVDVAVDSDGRVLLLDPATKRVRIFVAKDEAQETGRTADAS